MSMKPTFPDLPLEVRCLRVPILNPSSVQKPHPSLLCFCPYLSKWHYRHQAQNSGPACNPLAWPHRDDPIPLGPVSSASSTFRSFPQPPYFSLVCGTATHLVSLPLIFTSVLHPQPKWASDSTALTRDPRYLLTNLNACLAPEALPVRPAQTPARSQLSFTLPLLHLLFQPQPVQLLLLFWPARPASPYHLCLLKCIKAFHVKTIF